MMLRAKMALKRIEAERKSKPQPYGYVNPKIKGGKLILSAKEVESHRHSFPLWASPQPDRVAELEALLVSLRAAFVKNKAGEPTATLNKYAYERICAALKGGES